ncbi:MAG TPA: lysylphosphatidylglycerol synthase transmembrane domain-containing protein [Burkholderiales bacterium]|nr:lysylphosphatidylglycerol synthase transmembrane domain-containing protein [Burkholderiales bacterium]
MAFMSRRFRNFLLRLLVTAALVAFLVGKVDIGDVLTRLRRVDLRYAGAAAALLLLQLVLSGARWQLVARLLAVPLALQPAIRLALIGQFFSQALPSAIGGDAVRAWLVSRGNIGFGRALVTVVCDRAIGLVMLLAIACVTLPLFFERVTAAAPRHALAVLYAALWSGFLLLLWAGPRLLQPFMRFKVTAGLYMIVEGLRTLVRPRGHAATVLVLALVIQSAVIAGVYWLAQALGVAVRLGDCFAIVPPVMLAAMVPLSIAGWGVREGAMVAGFGLLGVPAADALAVSLLFGITQLALALPGGALWLRSGATAPQAVDAWSGQGIDDQAARPR